ncbi:MAG TPA: CBO0543 family protein [Bacillales bacterium]|nr:CBO0543 family protein [Bacillales bacterium]
MNIQWNVESIVLIGSTLLGAAGSLWIMKNNWKAYGFLFVISAFVGQLICYLFVALGYYSFPYTILPQISAMPFTAILTIFPFYVLLGVRYSPRPWGWKIPYYWVFVHLGMLGEVWAEEKTNLIRYKLDWNNWDSYTWWWIYLLLFEWVGGLLVPDEDRKPLDPGTLRFGRIGWFILHFVLIGSIYLAGVFTGYKLF